MPEKHKLARPRPRVQLASAVRPLVISTKPATEEVRETLACARMARLLRTESPRSDALFLTGASVDMIACI